MIESLSEQLSRYPFVRITIFWTAGIGLASVCSIPVACLWASAVWLALLGFGLSLRNRHPAGAWWTGVCFHLACFFAGAAWSEASLERHTVAWDGNTRLFRAVVVERPRVSEHSVRCCVYLVDSVSREHSMSVGRRVILVVPRSDSAFQVYPGDNLCFSGRITSFRNRGNPGEFDYAAYMRRQGVDGQCLLAGGHWMRLDSGDLYPLLSFSERIRLRALQNRTQLADRLASYGEPGRETSVIAALSLGEKSGLTREVRDLYAQTGVSHVLALSGLHLGILYFFLSFLLTGFGRVGSGVWWRESIILLFVWSYVWLAGAPVSLVRAAIMYSLLSFGRIRWSPLPSLNNLAVAAFLILLWNPSALFDVGFQLSFSAVAAILLGMPLLGRIASFRHRIVRYVWSVFGVSCCAQLGTAPLVAFYFHQFPVWFFLTNLLAVPLVSLLVVGLFLFLFGIVLGISAEFLQPLSSVLWALAALLNRILEAIRLLPGAVRGLYPDVPVVFLGYAFLLALWMSVRFRVRRARVYCILFLVVCVGWYLRPRTVVPGIWFYNEPACPTVHFVSDRNRSCVWTDSTSRFGGRPVALSEDFYMRNRMPSPDVLFEGMSVGSVSLHRSIVTFGAGRGVLLTDSTWYGVRADAPLPVGFLYVGQRCPLSPASASALFLPDLVILDIPPDSRRAERWRSFCLARRWTVHELRKEGACFLPYSAFGPRS